MKYYFKVLTIFGLVIIGNQAAALQMVKEGLFGNSKISHCMADKISEIAAPQEIIDIPQLKDEKGAALLDQKIPLGKFELYNPPEIYGKVVTLHLDGTDRMFVIDHYHIWHSHWMIEDSRRLVVGLFGLYIVPTTYSATFIVGTGAMLAWSYWGRSSLPSTQEASILSTVVDKLGLNKSLSETLDYQETPHLEPVYQVTKDGVKCIYQTYLRQNIIGKSLGIHIELRPLNFSEK